MVDISEELIASLKKKAVTLRKHIIRMTHNAQSGHPGGSMSAADIVTALYFHTLRVDPKNPTWPDRDRFVLSKGHACPVWYAALAERGFFPVDELLTFRKLNSRLQGHPELGTTPGVENAGARKAKACRSPSGSRSRRGWITSRGGSTASWGTASKTSARRGRPRWPPRSMASTT